MSKDMLTYMDFDKVEEVSKNNKVDKELNQLIQVLSRTNNSKKIIKSRRFNAGRCRTL